MIIRKFFEEITFLGGILFYLLLLIYFFLINIRIFYLLFSGLILIYFLTLLIRLFYFKNRPKKLSYSTFLGKIDANSFPSVHAARATFLFLILVLLDFYFIFLLPILLLVYLSRIYLGKHYLTDVVGGILLGVFCFILSIYFI